MKKRICLTIGALLATVLLIVGCAIKSPSEWQVVIGTVLFSAFQKGTIELAQEQLEKLHQDGLIDDVQLEELKALILEENPHL